MTAAKPKPKLPSAKTRRVAEELFTAEHVGEAWAEALELWGIEVNLSPPEPYVGGRADAWAGDEPLAYIDLRNRQVVVNLPLLLEVGAAGSLAAVLAHEIGHHLKFPHTLGLSASLQLLERRLIPTLRDSLTNLFFDLQVNEEVGRTRAAELAAVYRGFSDRSEGEVSSLFHYYLAIYEELWGLSAGALTSAKAATSMQTRFPGYRADARMFVQTFYALPDVYLQFVYFCSRFIHYVDPTDPHRPLPLSGDVPDPDADDYAGAMTPTSAERAAIEEAAEREWIDAGTAHAAEDDVAAQLRALERILSTRPGTEHIAFSDVAVGRLYKRLVDRHLIRLPETRPPRPEPFLPTIGTDWEPGDGPGAIDWTLSVLSHGPMAALRPQRRELEVEEPEETPGLSTAVEIYLDTSGSMPNPRHAVNAMTLAAQIVSAAALRRGGKVKALIYSVKFEESEWLYDEENARRFLLRYSGGGTAFPFERLVSLAEERPEVLRVVISDGDFLWNLEAKGALKDFERGLERTRMFIALLALPEGADEKLKKAFGSTAQHPRLRIGTVRDSSALPQAATALTRALWGG